MYKHSIDLKKFKVENTSRGEFAKRLEEMPYLGYEVEDISDGRKIVVAKPGGKHVYGQIKKDDFFVFIYNPEDETLWQISHKQILGDLEDKAEIDKPATIEILEAMERVYNGAEPDDALRGLSSKGLVGEKPEALLKAYKWIWGQEDVNYPPPRYEGRSMSWKGLKELLGNLKRG